MIKCIVCDLDGTLIRKDDTIEESTLQKIKQQINKGVELILATGRSYHMVESIMERYALSCDLILNNGAEYRNLKTGEIQLIPMEASAFERVVRILDHHGYLLAIHTDCGLYSCHTADDFWNYHLKLLRRSLAYGDQLPQKTFTIREKYLKNFHHISSPDEVYASGAQPLKIDARHFELASISGIKAQLNIPHLDISSSFEDNMEITSAHSNKGKLLLKIVEKKGYQKEEVAVFGDGENDSKMLAAFPYSFAPQNALDQVKMVVWHILSKTNQEGAVGEGISYLEKRHLL